MDNRERARTRDKKTKKTNFVWRITWKFYSGCENMWNASGHQGKTQQTGSEKKVNRTTYNISSIKRVTREFLEVSRCRRAKQRQRNEQEKCAARAKLLLIRPAVFVAVAAWTLRNHDDDGNGNVKKQYVLLAKQQLCTCITLFCTFLCLHYETTTWNDQILSLLGDGNGKAINSTISVRTWARSPLFSSSQNPLLLSNRANWDNREKV